MLRTNNKLRTNNLKIHFLVLGAIAAGGFAIRFLHLLGDHYFILSVDSYFFFWLAEKVAAGETPPVTWHSGLAYPLGYLALFISFLSGAAPADALIIASKILPPLLGVISMIVIYLAVSAIYDRRVGIFAAFAMAFMPIAYFIQAAGYVDRDGLSTLLIMSGAFALYLLKGWQWRIGRFDAGWLVGGVLVAGIGQLIYWQWIWVGRWLLLFILAIIFVALLVRGFLRAGQAKSSGDCGPKDCRRTKPNAGLSHRGDPQGFFRKVGGRGVTAVRESPWRFFVVVIGLSGLFELGWGGLELFISRAVWVGQAIVARYMPGVEGYAGFEMPIAELQNLTLPVIFAHYHFFVIPLVVGIFVALLKRRPADLFCLSWFLGFLILSLSAERILITALPAAAILSAVGLDFIFKRWSSRPVFRYSQTFIAVALISVLFLTSLPGAYLLGACPRIAPHENWQSALTFLREETAEDAVVMSWWDYGYWILALGQRRPVVDNGFHGWDEERLRDIGLAYVTDDPYEVVRVMKRRGADYFVFSIMERDIYLVIAQAALSGRADIPANVQIKNGDIQIRDPLFVRFLWKDLRVKGPLDVKGPLEVAYRNPEVVILRKRDY